MVQSILRERAMYIRREAIGMHILMEKEPKSTGCNKWELLPAGQDNYESFCFPQWT